MLLITVYDIRMCIILSTCFGRQPVVSHINIRLQSNRLLYKSGKRSNELDIACRRRLMFNIQVCCTQTFRRQIVESR